MEFFYQALELPSMEVLFMVLGILAIVFGVLMIDGINRDGKVIFISYLFRNKNLDDKSMAVKYKIQGYYTIVLGLFLMINVLYIKLPGKTLFFVLLGLALFDFLYDYFAIKSSKR